MIQLVIFLGNPGAEYRDSRHNLARRLLPELTFSSSLQWQKKFKGEAAEIAGAAGKVWLLQPGTFMNLSGESAQALASFYHIDRPQILAVHDDLELNFGLIGLKNGGGAAGHNGLRSLILSLGGNNFWRLRLGIGRPAHGSVESHVLGKFSGEERPWLTHIETTGANLLERCLREEPSALEKSCAKIKVF